MRLAINGRGRVEPNPVVGCVLVKDGQVIGEGYHHQYGQPHAEPNALADCRARGMDPSSATAYVTLEPCCYTNKQTPPCAPRLIEARIGRVVIGCLDPNPEVNGQGVQQLRSTGVAVDVAADALAAECRQLIASFILGQTHKRPYVTLKWAETADGRIAGHEGTRLQISGVAATRLVHVLRGRSDAIVVGAQTVLTDDPLLTIRHGVTPDRIPDRVLIDRRGVVPPYASLFGDETAGAVVIVTSLKAPAQNLKILLRNGVRLVWPPAHRTDFLSTALSAGAAVDKPYTHVLVEPGPTLARAFFAAGLCDRLWVIRSGKRLNDPSAPASAAVPEDFVAVGTIMLGDDVLIEYLNPNSEAFHAAAPSADFMLASS